MTDNPLFSIVIPVYNRKEYLKTCIESVFDQTYKDWELLIADDASNLETQEFLLEYNKDSRIALNFNLYNLGLFPNLNQAINRSKGKYILLLCSDDFFLSDCLQKYSEIVSEFSDVSLLLSAFNMVDAEGKEIPSGSITHYTQFVQDPLQVFETHQFVPLLLKWGCISGNLTGMCFKKDLFNNIGGFREDWQHAADWEWVYRSAVAGKILISLKSIATIRSHDQQLSSVNLSNLSNSKEVIEIVRILLKDPNISCIEESYMWAAGILQAHLWLALKLTLRGQFSSSSTIIKQIAQVMHLSKVLWALLLWLPERWQRYRQKDKFWTQSKYKSVFH